MTIESEDIREEVPSNVIQKKAIAAIVDSLEIAIYTKTLDGLIVSWNKGAEQIFGYSEDEILGKHVSILASPERSDEVPQILHRIKHGERVGHYETLRKRKDGTFITVSLSVSPIKDDSGHIVAASTIARDITDRSDLADIRNFLASIVDSSDDAILSKDLDGFILSWNDAAQRLYGYTAEEAIGRCVSLISPPEMPDEIPSIMERLRKGERISHYETTRVKKNGETCYISLTVSPIKDARGKVIAASAIARDITARKRNEEEMKRLMEELKQSLNEKNILLQEVYHRVKNNLQVISSLLDLRSRYIGKDPSKAATAFKESIERIRAMALVHEKLYKTDSLEKLNFGDYLRTLIEQLIRTYALGRKVQLKITGDACEFDLNTAIPLSLIFNELVTNSLKYAFTSAEKGFIEICTECNEQSWRLLYSDNGVGLPETVNFPTSDSFGFRIVKLLIKQLGGTISLVETTKGTAFEITIPRPSGGL
jgi:PAS domain S-box-containing protein